MKEYNIVASNIEEINKSIVSFENSKVKSAINQDLNKLSQIVVGLQNLKYEESFFSKLPIVGNIVTTMKKEIIEKKYDNTKALVIGLKNEITQKINHLKQDDLLLEPLIKGLTDSIEKNLTTIKEMKEDLKSIKKNKENAGEKLSLVNKIKNAEFLVKAQVIQSENLKSMKVQNLTLINDIETNLNTAIIAISTSALISQQLHTRNTLLKTEEELRKISNNMLHSISKEVSDQSIKYQNMILHKDSNDEKLLSAIDIIKQTREQYKDFNNNILPNVIDKISEQQDKIELLFNAMNEIADKDKKELPKEYVVYTTK